MFLQRALVSLTLGPLALYLLYLGGWFYFVPLAVILLLATAEYANMVDRLGWLSSRPLLLVLVAAQLIVGGGLMLETAVTYENLVLFISLLLVMAYGLWRYEYRHSQNAPGEWFAMMAGVLLLGWVGSHFFRLRGMDNTMAWQWTMLALLATWFADSGAYVVGKFLAGNVLGRHQLSPRLSPNKTVEGLLGGILLGTGLSVGTAVMLNLPLLSALILALLITLLSPLGDLGISLLKRESGIKDSGKLFPGHGGALDRIDSLLWSVTIAYYFVTFFT